MKQVLLVVIIVLSTTRAITQSQGPFSGTTFSSKNISGSSQDWTNNSNVSSSNDSYASFGDLPNTTGAYTDYLVVKGFGFSVPINASLAGIMVEVERSDPNQLTSDYSVRIVKNSSVGLSEKATGAAYPATDGYQSYGGPTDLWGLSWSHKDISNANFGVAIAAQRSGTGGVTAGQIDHVRITIFYTMLVTLPVNITSFAAVKMNSNTVHVKWNTSDESAIDHYEVERSVNGRDFNSIGSVISRNSNSTTTYTLNHNNPVKGGSYYRLKIVEQSGTQKYSSVAAVKFDETGMNKLFPNLVSAGQTISISNAGNEQLKVQFYNNNGQSVTTVGTNSGQVCTSSLPVARGILYYNISDTKGNITGSGRIVLQ